MAYYVDTGGSKITEHDTLQEALVVATNALNQGLECEARLGWRPFWIDHVEIRRGRRGLSHHLGGEENNQDIVAATTQVRSSQRLLANLQN